MLRDQGTETMDSEVLDDLTVADFNADTVRAYRNPFPVRHVRAVPGLILMTSVSCVRLVRQW